MRLSPLDKLQHGDQIAPAAQVGVSNLRLLQGSSLTFLVPNAILAFGFGAAPAGVVLFGCFLAAFILLRLERKRDGLLAAPIELATLGGCAAAAAALLLLAGETHLLFTNWDWLIRDGVLSDLVRQGFPAFYCYESQDYLLRAPLGMYLLPAAVGHFGGLKAAHLALLAQNASLLALCLYFVALLASTARRPVFLLLFVLFSGLDALPQLLLHGLEIPDHLEWWAGFIQYSSHVTQLFWVPNHALPGWWLAVLLLLFVRGEMDFAVLLATFAATPLWSPLSALGAAPLVALLGLPLGRVLFAPRILAAGLAGLALAPVAIYLTLDATAVRREWLVFQDGFALLYAVFIAVEIPQAAIVVAAWSKIERCDRALVAAAIAILLVIPVYLFGPSNDLAMRASITPLFLLAFAFAKVATSTPRDGRPLASIISAVAIVSAATPLVEVKRALVEPAYAISDCGFLTAWKKADPTTWPANYLARIAAVPSWLMKPSEARLTVEDKTCWPDHPRLSDSPK